MGRRARDYQTIPKALSVPEFACKWGVAQRTVRVLIERGVLAATNVAKPGADRPQFRISPESEREFVASRTVSGDQSLSTTQRLRKRATSDVERFI